MTTRASPTFCASWAISSAPFRRALEDISGIVDHCRCPATKRPLNRPPARPQQKGPAGSSRAAQKSLLCAGHPLDREINTSRHMFFFSSRGTIYFPPQVRPPCTPCSRRSRRWTAAPGMNYEQMQKSGPIFCIRPEKNDFVPTFWKFSGHTWGLDFAISTNVSGNVSSKRLVSDSLACACPSSSTQARSGV